MIEIISDRDRIESLRENARRAFSTHVATMESPTRLKWMRQDGSSIYAATYSIDVNRLIVLGDMENAVYCWSSLISFEFVAGCDLSYFAGKCSASPHARRFECWDGAVARHEIEQYFQDREKDSDVEQVECPSCAVERSENCTVCDGWGYTEVPVPLKERQLWVERDGAAATYDEHEFIAWMRENGYDVIGDSWYEHEFGQVISPMCIYQLEGLKLAVAQLATKAVAA